MDRGDIYQVNLNPSAGREQQGTNRPVMILSPAAFNQTLGVVWIAPITQGGKSVRALGFAVDLEPGMKTAGVVLCNQIRAIDMNDRAGLRVETAPKHIVDDVLARVTAVLS